MADASSTSAPPNSADSPSSSSSDNTSSRSDEDGSDSTQESTSPLVPQSQTRQQKLTMILAVFFNVLCGFTSGYELCVISTVLKQIVAEFDVCGVGAGSSESGVVTCDRKELIFSLFSVGSMLARLLLGWISDQFGRRLAIALADVLILGSVLLQCFATDVANLLTGRFVLGLGLGLAFFVEPAYVCEIAPADRRGRLVILNEVAVCSGCMLGLQLSAALLKTEQEGIWRTAVGLGAIPAIIQLLFLFILPESPRWLCVQGKVEEMVLAANRLGLPSKELEVLREEAQSKKQQSRSRADCNLLQLWHMHLAAWREHKKSFMMALGFSFFTTASGIFAMQGYARDILQSCGVSHPAELLPLLGWIKLAGAMTGVLTADLKRIGRRMLAVTGGTGCTVTFLILAARRAAPSTVPSTLAAVAFFAFIFSWNIGYGSLQFVATLELLPNSVRSLWGGVIFACGGVVEVVIFQEFESVYFVHPVWTTLFFALVNGASALFAACVMADMTGASLEEAKATVEAGKDSSRKEGSVTSEEKSAAGEETGALNSPSA